jgi:hypothetical protein
MPEPDLRFPIGKFHFPETVSAAELNTFVDQIAATPAEVRASVRDLDDMQLDTPYRPSGWTVRQLVHHIPDSHINSYVRYRLALTEDTPVIKPYAENLWAELADARTMPIAPSLDLLESVHARWVPLLRSLSPSDWSRSFRHPELGPVRLDQNAALYAWHGRHHVAHITRLRDRMGW